jgi:hypothetical protein
MNWKRIWTGALLAGFVFFGLDFLINHVILMSAWREFGAAGHLRPFGPHIVPVLIIKDLLIGYVLMWLYALARPRLGPGPRTAFQMGTIAWLLMYVPSSVALCLFHPISRVVPGVYFVGGLLQCWICIYLAGWQYIERAP